MNQKSKFILCSAITIVSMTLVISFATKGNLANDLVKYRTDLILFIIYLVIGPLLTKKVLSTKLKLDGISIAFSYLYFYSAFCVFSDGYIAGWSHSSDEVLEKLFRGGLISILLIVTIYVPLVALAVSTIHNIIIKTVRDWRYG
ncbi:hypothetical protein [Ferrimonas kyonanensis]|uniref:hypothetical protein n=1 Tax=Ferrimonas kyonanensis TaxID=364763 RepID=UPI0012EB3B6C|nr:hypothetical protein [Ferrimonas kyonanensis]